MDISKSIRMYIRAIYLQYLSENILGKSMYVCSSDIHEKYIYGYPWMYIY